MEKVFAGSDSNDMAKACLVESPGSEEINFIAPAGGASGQDTCNRFAY